MSNVRVLPRSTSRESDDLGCTVRKVYGYRAQCKCGWLGHTYGSVREARLEASFHTCTNRAA